jgi:alpha-amylase/alpha-mannosidase (GH57 family)
LQKYICIHGHFYQPPRENPWLEEVELQDSSYPFHDWNERITSECYSRNAASRILNAQKKITKIVNNYARISFNFGPTLLSWMEKKDPDVYADILRADKISQEKFSGHGSALAQVYNHMILPLANTHDKRTQIYWGIRDFEHRFKRKPEGMWLAETAVDLESLSIMAEYGIKFTLLAPHQAKSVKPITSADWFDVTGQRIDPKKPYLCRLPSGKSIAIFFYDGPMSRSVAFEGLLKSGDDFVRRLLGGFDYNNGQERQLVHIATDGETYGHHHRFADMALAYAIHKIETENLATLTIYGEYLEKFPPQEEVQILENTSWSCSHGVERWRADCGCCLGTNPKWNQKWRAPLRQSLDYLSEEATKVYARHMSPYVHNIWAVRNAYIDVILNRDEKIIEHFFADHILKPVNEEEKVKILKLLEMQRNMQLMYTSCGWFFDEISRIEPIQILKYAARVLQLVAEIDGLDLENNFLDILAKANSNEEEYKDGRDVYLSLVRPSVVDLLRVGVHYAVSSLFEDYPKESNIYSYSVINDDCKKKEANRLKICIGRGSVRSIITFEKTPIFFVSFHMGNHNMIRSIDKMTAVDYTKAQKEILDAFEAKKIPETTRMIDKYFGHENYTIQHLFRNEQQKILDEVLKTTMEQIEGSFMEIYEQHYPLMQIQKELPVRLPKVLSTVVEFVLSREMCQEIERDPLNLKRIQVLAWELKRWSFSRDREGMSFVTTTRLSQLMKQLSSNHEDVVFIENIVSLLNILNTLNFQVNLWKAQNIFFDLRLKYYGEKKKQACEKDARSERWVSAFELLGEFLGVAV